MTFTTVGKVKIIELCFNYNHCASVTYQLLNQQHVDKYRNRKYLLKLVTQFWGKESVLNKTQETKPT